MKYLGHLIKNSSTIHQFYFTDEIENFQTLLDRTHWTNTSREAIWASINNKIVSLENVSKSNVLNLSDIPITKKLNSTLEKGLSFSITNNSKHLTKSTISTICARISIDWHFRYNPFNERNRWPKPSILNTTFSEHSILNPWLDTISNLDCKSYTYIQPNVDKDDMEDLLKLKNNKSIIIKKSDKTSTIAIMNKKDYIFETERQRQLSNTDFYKLTDHSNGHWFEADWLHSKNVMRSPAIKVDGSRLTGDFIKNEISTILRKMHAEHYINDKELSFIKNEIFATTR